MQTHINTEMKHYTTQGLGAKTLTYISVVLHIISSIKKKKGLEIKKLILLNTEFSI